MVRFKLLLLDAITIKNNTLYTNAAIKNIKTKATTKLRVMAN